MTFICIKGLDTNASIIALNTVYMGKCYLITSYKKSANTSQLSNPITALTTSGRVYLTTTGVLEAQTGSSKPVTTSTEIPPPTGMTRTLYLYKNATQTQR